MSDVGVGYVQSEGHKVLLPDAATERIAHAAKTNAAHLDLSRLGLTDVPEALGSLTNLAELRLDGNLFTQVPPIIGSLTTLTKLYLNSNQITRVSDVLGSLTKLTTLHLDGNELTQFPEAIASLTNLTTLGLADNQLTQIPDIFSVLTKLTTLRLDGNRLTQIPDTLGSLTKLTTLHLHDNQLTQIPDTFGSLTNLTTLYLSNNQLTYIPEILGSLTKLTTLHLDRNQLTQIPEILGSLTKLTTLHLHDNQLTQIPDIFSVLAKLTTLDLHNNQLTQIPDTFGSLTRLATLRLDANRFKQVPDILGSLANLTRLDLDGNQLTQLPDMLGSLTNLTTLYLDSNQLTQLPDTIGSLTNLTTLYLSNNQLTHIPDIFGSLTNLIELNLDGNQLTRLPDTIGQLTKLTELTLNGNQLTQIPDVLGSLTNLTTLGLSRNRLTQVPHTLGGLNNLYSLRLDGNRLTTVPPLLWPLAETMMLTDNPLVPEVAAAIAEGADELGSLLRSLQREGEEVREAKLVLVGEGEVGKSSLLAALRGEEFIDGRLTTHGVEVKPVGIEVYGQPATLNGWDFGGQPFYRPTHQLYFTAPAIYLVVWSPRRGPDVSNVEYWTNLIKHRAGDTARIHIVASFADDTDRHALIDEARLTQQHGDMIAGYHHIDSRTGTGIAELKRAIAATAATLPHLRRDYPRSWLSLLQAFREGTDTYLVYDEYERRANAHGLTTTSARSLARNANALGQWIYYDTDDALNSIIIFKPDWLSKAISYVLEDPQVHDHHGLVSHRSLAHTWTHPPRADEPVYPASLHPAFRHLMQKFDISYPVRSAGLHDEPKILITQLVPTTQPDLRSWTGYGAGLEEQTQICEITDPTTDKPVIPEGLMYQLIARFHRFSLGRDDHTRSLHWETGLVVDQGDHGRALITIDDNRITVTVRAAYPQFFLSRLTEDIREHITGYWLGVDVKTLVPCTTSCANGTPGRGRFSVKALIASKRDAAPRIPCRSCDLMQNVDELMLAVPVSQVPSAARLAVTVAELLRPDFDAITAAILMQGNQTQQAISQAEERYRDLIRSLDEPARNGPRLFTHTIPNRTVQHPGFTHRRVRITLWCEHSRQPLPLLNDDPTSGVYDIDLPHQWFVAAGPWLKATSVILRTLLPIATGIMDLPADAHRSTLANQLRIVEDSFEASFDAATLTPIDRAEERHLRRATGDEAPDYVNPALLSTLHKIIGDRDPSFGGLRRVKDREHYKWVHPRFLAEYEASAD
ncbi:Leucine-rich repeat (LRR) protein/GTPase SAR1 family protein [Allocatelliglobosispora scoriae]|uniref:non-specific serine/threonine protein kinase n=1 Tax=Allocatelliglobosispora scoriae TaxID=643052 RepID=A0A841C2P3_9ACTN|nr:leucine-rich repeat domain-containing protein [Allocatelliglobosispora scoriae]MBB5874185.1 Leucine-rich repeat (LRR) protein/GTPase SAR1 family protein [Allocatelliglobosispora scoriae]